MGGSRDPAIGGEVLLEGLPFLFAQLSRMPPTVEAHVVSNPENIGFLGAQALVAFAEMAAEDFQQGRRPRGRRLNALREVKGWGRWG